MIYQTNKNPNITNWLHQQHIIVVWSVDQLVNPVASVKTKCKYGDMLIYFDNT